MLSAGQAAKHAGVSKTTISTALKSGRLSYVEKVGNQYRIDPSELERVFPRNSKLTVELDEAKPHAEHGLTQAERDAYETQIRLLRELLDEVRGDRDHLRQLQIADQRKPNFWHRLFSKAG